MNHFPELNANDSIRRTPKPSDVEVKLTGQARENDWRSEDIEWLKREVRKAGR